MEQSAGFWRYHQREHAARPGRFAKQGNVGGVAAKGVNIILHPLQRGDLVKEGEIIDPFAVFPFQRRMGEEPQMPQPIVDGHHHHVAGRQRFAIVRRQAAGANGKPAAVQPDHNRQRLSTSGGCPDVKVETIF